MSVSLNHTIVWCRDQKESSRYLTDTLGLPEAKLWGPFDAVEMGNGVSLDYLGVGPDAQIVPQHYAFLVSEAEFDEIFGRLQEAGQDFWADPFHERTGEINRNDGGRGVYFEDPNGHNLEIITRPYGSG